MPWVRDDTFLEGTFWQDSLHRYHRFLRHWIMDQSDKKVLLLELGVGEMTPSIIKLPFWELTAKNENVFYACLNREVILCQEKVQIKNDFFPSCQHT